MSTTDYRQVDAERALRRREKAAADAYDKALLAYTEVSPRLTAQEVEQLDRRLDQAWTQLRRIHALQSKVWFQWHTLDTDTQLALADGRDP